MATTERDYYEVLGVERTADEAEIKKAFRRLARSVHPDVSDAPDAEERFREVVEAYEVLSKPETRELYDRYGHAGLRSGGFTPTQLRLRQPLRPVLGVLRRRPLRRRRPGRRVRGADVAAQVEIELAEAASGVTREVPFPVTVACPTLRGQRRRARNRAGDVPDLRGRGPGRARVAHRLRRVRPHADVLALRRRRPRGRAPVRRVRGRRPGRRGADARGRRPARDPRRPADPHLRRGPRRRARRARRRRLRARADPTRSALRARGQRPLHDRRPDDDPGGARRDGAGRRRSTARSSSSSSRARSRARCASCVAAGCRSSRASAAATSACSSTSQVPRRLTDEQRTLLQDFESKAGDETYQQDEGFFEKLKSAFR